MTAAGSSKAIVFRGDDTGMCEAANRAVAQCFHEGVLRNTSVMAVGDAVADAAARFASCPKLCIGLHITLNSEWTHPRFRPVLPPEQVPSLVDDRGCFLPAPVDLHERGVSLAEIAAEVQAQLDRLRGNGLEPAYLDEHMGVGWIEGVRDQFLALAEREGLIVGTLDSPPLPKLEAASEKSDRVETLIQRIAAAPPGRYVLVTHPLMLDEQTMRITRDSDPPGKVAADRDGDRRMLIDPRLIRFCREQGVHLSRYDDPISSDAVPGASDHDAL